MKKQAVYIILLIAIGTSVLPACKWHCVRGSGHQVAENRKMTDFSEIEISGGYRVNLKQDSSLNVNITADDNLLKYIKTYVEGNTLYIDSKRNFCNSGEIVINIGVRQLKELKASGAIEINSEGTLVTKDFDMDFSGASKITLNLNAANVSTTGSGATELNLTGQASSHQVNLSGDGNVHALDFVVGNYEIESSGSSSCEINVLHRLDIHSSGSADVRYRGNPETINNDKSGSSSLTKID